LVINSSLFATTQPSTQNNLEQFCWGGISIGKKNHTTTPGNITIQVVFGCAKLYLTPSRQNFLLLAHYNELGKLIIILKGSGCTA
jgi:hypothetical protein